MTATKYSKIILKILPVTIRGPKGCVNTYAMLDDGAESCLISPGIAAKTGLKGEKKMVRAKAAWKSSASEREVQTIECTINADGKTFPLRARILEGFELPLQKLSKADVQRFPHLCRRMDVLPFYDSKAEVLIGQDHYHLMVTQKFIRGRWGEPYATKTPLGWCVHGTLNRTIKRKYKEKRVD